MSRYLISVGGSGQHVALAVTRLVYLQALRPDIRLVAIDPDTKTPLPQLLEDPAGMSGTRHPLQAGRVFAPFDLAKLGEKPFEAMFGDPSHPAESELFEALFDPGAASIPIYKGMYGTPSVGATVFAEGVRGTALQNLLSPLRNASQVFICGSVVGGTGAGLAHKLIGEIRKHYERELYGIFLLPWFRLEAGEQKGGITAAILDRNAKHGIKYFYEHTIPQLDASALIGYPGNLQTSVLKPLVVKQGDMGEHPHFLHLAAAWAMVTLPHAHTAHRNVRSYFIAHDQASETWLLDEPWEAGSISLRRLIRAHRILYNLLQFISLKKRDIVEYYNAGFLGRTTFHSGAASAWGELHQSIKQNVPPDGREGVFATQVTEELERIRREVEFCVHWAERIFPQSLVQEANDALLDELNQASANLAQSAIHWEKIRGYWLGGALPRNTARPNTAERLAQHHARLILQAAMR